jgi:hypothetical protein
MYIQYINVLYIIHLFPKVMSGSLTVPPGGELYEKEVVDIRSVLHSNTLTTE